MSALARLTLHEQPEAGRCPACEQLRTALRFCLGALASSDATCAAVQELVRGGIVLQAEIALRTACSCDPDSCDGRSR
jgi:hypothetical protein